MTSLDIRRVVYPGTFNPPTVAHLAIVEAVVAAYAPVELDLVLSRRAILKEHVEVPSLDDRVLVIEESVAHLSGVSVRLTDARLIVDIAAGYDLVVMGADKWRQVHDPAFYDDVAHRDDALARLPRVGLVSRGDDAGDALQSPLVEVLPLPVGGDHGWVSSTAARDGARELMTPAARRFDDRTGAWTRAGRSRGPAQ